VYYCINFKQHFIQYASFINEETTWAIYFTHLNIPPDSPLTLTGRNIPFINSVKYLGVISDERMVWRLHIEMIEAKAFRPFIRIYSLFKSERLSANIKSSFHKALIRSLMTYVCLPRLRIFRRITLIEIAAPAK
jgi:hypothetical protein